MIKNDETRIFYKKWNFRAYHIYEIEILSRISRILRKYWIFNFWKISKIFENFRSYSIHISLKSINRHMYVHIYTLIHIYISIYMCTYVRIYVYMCVYIYIYVYMHIYAYICMYMYIHMYVYVYVYKLYTNYA